MTRLYVKNWDEFQHYKDRSPPWIKLHKTILDNYEFFCLPVASRALAPCIWLLASEDNTGSIEHNPVKIAFRLRMTEKEVTEALGPLIDKGFLYLVQDASTTLADCEHNASNVLSLAHSQETEAEAETDIAPNGKRSSRKSPISFDFDTGRFVGITDDMKRLWAEAYPALGLETEIAKAAAWLLANPRNRKSNYPKFLTGWFCRAQDKAPARLPNCGGDMFRGGV